MAEPWVPKSELAPAQADMDDVEGLTDLIEPYTDEVAADAAETLGNLNEIATLSKNALNPLLLGGA